MNMTNDGKFFASGISPRICIAAAVVALALFMSGCMSSEPEGMPIAVEPDAPTSGELLSALRSERDRRLAACDYTQLADCPMDKAQRAAWKIYRQALRELPDTTTDLADIAWPIHPDL